MPLIILTALACLIWWMLHKAQKSGKLQIEQMFQDDSGRASSGRVIGLGAWALASWYLAIDRLSDTPSVEVLKTYLWVFGIVLVGHKALEVAGEWAPKPPKPDEPPPVRQ
jgi:hypothetical protein